MADYRFIKVHNGFPEHRKTIGLSDRAFRNLIELWCYCSRNTTDGRVPKVFGNRVVSSRSKRELIDAGWMLEHDSDYEMIDYLEHQVSAERIADLREKRAAAGAKGGKAKANGLANASDGLVAKSYLDRDVDRDVEKEESDAPASDLPRDDVERVCTYLADRIEGNGSKRPTIGKSWRQEARMLIDKDGRSVDQIIRAVDFSQDDVFWKINILSMPKLREKYDALRLAAQRESEQSPKAKRGPTYIGNAPGQMRIEQ